MILRDNSTVHDGELLFALPAGETRITVQSAGPLALYGIRLLPPETLLSYAQVSAGYPEIRTVAAWETEAENMLERSDSAIRRQSDQSDPSVAPSTVSYTHLEDIFNNGVPPATAVASHRSFIESKIKSITDLLNTAAS